MLRLRVTTDFISRRNYSGIMSRINTNPLSGELNIRFLRLSKVLVSRVGHWVSSVSSIVPIIITSIRIEMGHLTPS